MTLILRLRGKKNKQYRTEEIIVIHKHIQRDGKYVEKVGIYNRKHSFFYINMFRVGYWMSKGITITDAVTKLLLQYKLL